MAESSAGDFTVGNKIQKTRRQRVAKMYGQQKRNIIHISSTAYEQDHSAAAPSSRVMNSRRPAVTAPKNPMVPLLRTRSKGPCDRAAAQQRDELASFQMIELHSVPAAEPDRRVANCKASFS